MAESDYVTKPQRLVSEIGRPKQNQENSSKFFAQVLYKALFVILFFVVLPLFPSQAPEFISQTVFTRSWELLHVLFVGIAVSYGLFSRRNDDVEEENYSKFDNANSYVSQFLEVSSVFDDGAESPSGSDQNKVQTWTSQYHRGEPVVVVAQEQSVLEDHRGSDSSISEKPLILPVRSLKSKVSDPDRLESTAAQNGLSKPVKSSISSSGSKRSSRNGERTRSRSWSLESDGARFSKENNVRPISNSGSKRYPSNGEKARNGEVGRIDAPKVEEKPKESVVLRSPIPWRSRSGRMELKEDTDLPPLDSLPPSMDELEINPFDSRSSRSQNSRSSWSSPMSSTPQTLSPSPSLSSLQKLSPLLSLSSESQAKSVEDFVRKKSFNRSPPQPHPPPPPPPPLPPPPPPPPPFSYRSPLMKSNFSSVKNEVSSEKLNLRFRSLVEDLKWSNEDGPLNRLGPAMEAKQRGHTDSSSNGKSVRTIRASESSLSRRARDFGDDGVEGRAETRNEFKGYDETSVGAEKKNGDSISFFPRTIYTQNWRDKKKEVDAMVTLETEDDSDENDEIERSSDKEEATCTMAVSDEGPDVDKKADEFIAKFREQIRLQRIESIKRSSGQLSRNSTR